MGSRMDDIFIKVYSRGNGHKASRIRVMPLSRGTLLIITFNKTTTHQP